MRDKKTITYESEYIDTLEQLLNTNKQLPVTKYFLDTAFHYINQATMKKRNPKVIVLGTAIPEEYIYAAGETPFWILGGSLGAASWADEYVPRDTDAISQSVLGFLMNKEFNLAKDAVAIVPITSDSARKTAYILKKAGYQIITIDIPPVKNDPMALDKWVDQMNRMSDALSRFTGYKTTKESLLDACVVVGNARRLMREFLFLAKDREHILTEPMRMLILNSYYYTEDIEQWSLYLSKLNKKLQTYPTQNKVHVKQAPKVLLMGSPVIFPNYKIPLLIQNIGLSIYANADIMTERIYIEEVKFVSTKKDYLMSMIAKAYYRADCSDSYASNKTMYSHVEQLIRQGGIDGVVYHVLKGQIEYDFELERFEKLFAAYQIPVFRLETDYQYQDVEQLRIRMEAFMEMLSQNQYQNIDIKEVKRA